MPKTKPTKIKKKKARIRPLALCIFRWEDRIFVAEGYDSLKSQTFYRPIGGGIEFGETAADTVAREVMEEIHQPVKDLQYLATLENIFVYMGETGHEIVLMFDGQFVNPKIYDENLVVHGKEDGDDQELFKAFWKPLSFFQEEGAPPLYPNGLLEMLEKQV